MPQSSLLSEHMAAAMTSVRLDARHGLPPFTHGELKRFCYMNACTPEAVRKAEEEGRRLRASGAKCLCRQCEIATATVIHREENRNAYRNLRHQQLFQAGQSNYGRRESAIEAEISAGVVHQIQPTQITRTKEHS